MLIYMIRHGQTDWNAEGRFQGQKDIPLNATGRGQAIANGEVLARLLDGRAGDFDFISSPMARARETMERMRTAMDLDSSGYRTDERLLEISFGSWEGRTFRELQGLYPEAIAARAQNKWSFIPPGDLAESYEILSWRIAAWLASLRRPAICVSHGGVIRTVLKLVGGWPEDQACETDIPQDKILKVEPSKGSVVWL